MNKFQEKYNKEVVPAMKKKFGYTNNMAVPKIVKIAINAKIGSIKDQKRKDMIRESLSVIVGQKSVVNNAKKAIASFGTRQGMPIGYSVTLRGGRMEDFFEKMTNSAIPRVRDFRGIDSKAVDASGNLTIGFKEHIVFPEASKEDVRQAFGVGVTIVANGKTKEENLELLKLMGIPFKRQE